MLLVVCVGFYLTIKIRFELMIKFSDSGNKLISINRFSIVHHCYQLVRHVMNVIIFVVLKLKNIFDVKLRRNISYLRIFA